jgi:hypothetical protein
MNTTMKLLGAGALALALAACNQEEADPYLDYVPDDDTVSLELQGGAAEGALAIEVGSAAAVADVPNGNVEDLAAGREKLRALNEAVREVFRHVIAVARDGRQLPGQVKVYGPADRCVQPTDTGCADGGMANLRLTIFRITRNLGSFLLEARPQGSTDDLAFEPVLAGYLARGDAGRRGGGKLAVNFENLGAAAPGFTGEGHALAGFFSGPVVKSITYRMLGFTRDPAQHDPVTAAFHGYRTASGVTRVRLAGIEDLDVSGPDTELGFWHLVYHPALGGRSYSVITNYLAGGVPHGDVPPAPGGGPQYWFGRACYDAGATTPAFKEWFLCPRGLGARACVDAAGGVGDVVVGTGTWAENCSLASEPAEFALPGVPATTPDDVSAEAGHPSDADAPPPPVDVEDVNP